MNITFTVYGKPQQQGSKKAFIIAGKARLRETNAERQKNWYGAVAQQAALVMGERAATREPCRLSAVFMFTRPQAHYGTGKNSERLKPNAPSLHAQTPDISKLARCIEDAMTGIVYHDDRQIFSEHIERQWVEVKAGAEITIEWDGK